MAGLDVLLNNGRRSSSISFNNDFDIGDEYEVPLMSPTDDNNKSYNTVLQYNDSIDSLGINSEDGDGIFLLKEEDNKSLPIIGSTSILHRNKRGLLRTSIKGGLESLQTMKNAMSTPKKKKKSSNQQHALIQSESDEDEDDASMNSSLDSHVEQLKHDEEEGEEEDHEEKDDEFAHEGDLGRFFGQRRGSMLRHQRRGSIHSVHSVESFGCTQFEPSLSRSIKSSCIDWELSASNLSQLSDTETTDSMTQSNHAATAPSNKNLSTMLETALGHTDDHKDETNNWDTRSAQSEPNARRKQQQEDDEEETKSQQSRRRPSRRRGKKRNTKMEIGGSADDVNSTTSSKVKKKAGSRNKTRKSISSSNITKTKNGSSLRKQLKKSQSSRSGRKLKDDCIQEPIKSHPLATMTKENLTTNNSDKRIGKSEKKKKTSETGDTDTPLAKSTKKKKKVKKKKDNGGDEDDVSKASTKVSKNKKKKRRSTAVIKKSSSKASVVTDDANRKEEG